MTGIYAIKHPHGYFKIGKSDDPHSRYSNIQTGSPYSLSLWCVVSTNGDAEALEKRVHDCLSEYHHRGEWFKIADKRLLEVLESEVKRESSEAFHIRKPDLTRQGRTAEQTTFNHITHALE